MADSQEAQIVEGLREAAKDAGFGTQVGKFDLMNLPDGTVCVRPVTVKPTSRDSSHQYYELRALLGVRSKARGDDDDSGKHAFTKLCNDCGTLLRAIISSARFQPGGQNSVAAKITRGEVQYWYRPAAKSGQAGGGILAVTVTWRESV